MAYLVGIAGGTGTGKGTIADLISRHLETWKLSCAVLSTDDFYKNLSLKSKEERDNLCFDPNYNYDHPAIIDFNLLVDCATNFKEGRPFQYKKYDFKIHTHGDEKIEVPGNLDVAVIEGLYALYSGQEVKDGLISLYDHRIFVATTPEIAQNRRISRDIRERGRELEHVLKQLNTTVVPMQKKYVYPTQMNAYDIVDWRVDESLGEEQITEKLTKIARSKAIYIYESVKKMVLPELDLETVKIF